MNQGILTKYNTALKYGIITLQNTDKIFLTGNTDFGGLVIGDTLNIGDRLIVFFKKTSRGLEAVEIRHDETDFKDNSHDVGPNL